MSTIAQRVLCRAGSLLRPFGCVVVTLDRVRNAAWGSPIILGSFPPLSEASVIGERENWFIHDGYNHRAQPSYCDKRAATDEGQDEVYRFARELCDRDGLNAVLDFGCGSGYKLIKYFAERRIVGVDVPETCEWLRKKYPRHLWLESVPEELGYNIDLVISADVIEHLATPDEVLDIIDRIRPRFAILSTPDRNLLRYGTHNGPPLNPTHLREWSFPEFHAYIEDRFEVLEHFICCAPQATQVVLCRPFPQK